MPYPSKHTKNYAAEVEDEVEDDLERRRHRYHNHNRKHNHNHNNYSSNPSASSSSSSSSEDDDEEEEEVSLPTSGLHRKAPRAAFSPSFSQHSGGPPRSSKMYRTSKSSSKASSSSFSSAKRSILALLLMALAHKLTELLAPLLSLWSSWFGSRMSSMGKGSSSKKNKTGLLQRILTVARVMMETYWPRSSQGWGVILIVLFFVVYAVSFYHVSVDIGGSGNSSSVSMDSASHETSLHHNAPRLFGGSSDEGQSANSPQQQDAPPKPSSTQPINWFAQAQPQKPKQQHTEDTPPNPSEAQPKIEAPAVPNTHTAAPDTASTASTGTSTSTTSSTSTSASAEDTIGFKTPNLGATGAPSGSSAATPSQTISVHVPSTTTVTPASTSTTTSTTTSSTASTDSTPPSTAGSAIALPVSNPDENLLGLQWVTDPSAVPMTRNVVDLMVPGNTGSLLTDQVKGYYRKLAQAYLKPFSAGITRESLFDILKRRTYGLTPPGANKGIQSMLIQIIDGKVWIMDPYEVPKNSKPFYRSRINEMIWLLNKLVAERPIKNTEFLVSIHDCVQTASKEHPFRAAKYPENKAAFTIVSCNFSDNIPFPMWEGGEGERGGGYEQWEERMKDYMSSDTTGWESKTQKAVFRGGIRPSCYLSDKTAIKERCDEVGRSKLANVAESHPDLFDVSVGGSCKDKKYSLKRMAPKDHHKFKYIIYAEGNCFWADRINIQVFGPSMIFKQETPCGQFFEPLLRPGTHYVPVDFFFNDLPEKVEWAKANDDKARQIVKNANEFAWNFLSLNGIMSYVEVLLDEYTSRLNHKDKIVKETGAIDATGLKF